jgi:DNA gyrase inhibitor GyrI
MKKLITLCILFTCTSGFLAAQDKNAEKKDFKVTIRDFAETNLVYYPFTGPYDQSFNNFGKLMAYLEQNKIPLGACSLGIFYDDPATVSADKLRSEVGMMVAKKAEVKGEFRFKVIPAGKAVSVRYKSMDDIMAAYQAIGKFVAEKGIKTEPYSIEIYYSADPAIVDAEVLMIIKP